VCFKIIGKSKQNCLVLIKKKKLYYYIYKLIYMLNVLYNYDNFILNKYYGWQKFYK